jgi:hypothetical protein
MSDNQYDEQQIESENYLEEQQNVETNIEHMLDTKPSESESESSEPGLLSSSSSSSSSCSSDSSSETDSSDSDSDDEGPSRWQHWKRWEGPWYKKNKNNIIVPRTGEKVNLLSCDSDVPIEISIEAVMGSSFIYNMLNDLGMDSNVPIPIVNTTSEIIKYIVEYLEYLYDNPKPEEWDINEKQIFTEWEENYILMVHEKLDITNLATNYNDIKISLQLYCKKLDNLCITANFLDIKPLLKLCTCKFAKILEQIPPKHMGLWCQELFGTANDHSPEEYEKMIEEHEKYFGDQ